MASSRADFGTDTIRIGVRTLDSRTTWVQTHKDTLISDLKEVLSHSTDIPRERQRLLWGGREMTDENSLSSYNLRNDHVLHLVTGHPNAVAFSHDLIVATDPPFVNGLDQFPFNIRFHGYGTMRYAREIISYFSTGVVMNLPGNPDIAPENFHLMASLSMEAFRLTQSYRGRGRTHIATVPHEQPLVRMLHSTTSLLNNLTRSVYMMRSMIEHQSRDPELFQQRLVNNARILRSQLWNSSQFLERLGRVMNDLTIPNMPEAAVNLPSQSERTTSRRRNDGASSSNADASDFAENRNTRPSRRRRRDEM